ncbi:hypothetical protein P5V15_013924 [Pogonomyrmex californicus]
MKIGIDPIESIAAFYAGQSIFLTGSTGFFGKIFIEKVLRSCKDVCEIFVLIRPKKGMNIDERLKKMLTLPLFDKLRNEQPSSFKKLIPILGDSSEKELGLSLSDKQMLIERVTIIVHAAASVRFNESLKYSILVNTRSTRDICVLAESMKNLTALVYVSTGYTQTDHPVIEEKVYPPKADWRKTIQIAESMDDHILNIFTAKYMNNAANTYVFSKNLAEGVIKDYSASLPCAIIRPTMVFPALSEPYSGWIDNVYGPIGLLVSGGKGLLRITFCQTNICQDWIPIDIVIKSLLQVIWKRGTIPYDQSMATSDSTPLVFNCASGHLQKISMSENLKLGTNLIRESPYDENLYECNSYVTNNFTLFYILTILWHVLPAMFIDLILKWFNFKFRFLKLHRNIYVAVCALKYFIINEWTFDNKNTMLLNETLPPVNVKEFQFQFNFNQRDLIKNALLGTKKYLFNDDVSTAGINIARARYRRLEILNMILKTCIILGMLWTFHHWKVLLYLVLSYILLPFRLCTVSFYNILA